MNLPLEFDINIYRDNNKHLEKMNANEILQHYYFYGLNEGLESNSIKTRKTFINLIPQDKMILEIGPLAFPCMNVNNSNIHTVDYFSKDELKELYKNDPNVDINKICNVTYILKNSTRYNEIIPKIFDFCFSSHNIEHVPCLITFLTNVSSILKNNSYFFLCIPDYRFCFDHFRNPSNIFEVLNSFYNGQNKPSPVSHLESCYLTCHNDSVKHWEQLDLSIRNIFVDINEKKEFIKTQQTKIIENIEHIKNMYEHCKNNYIDSHCWKFNPFIFRNIIEILYDTKFIDLKIERIYSTKKGSNEFYVILKKNDSIK